MNLQRLIFFVVLLLSCTSLFATSSDMENLATAGIIFLIFTPFGWGLIFILGFVFIWSMVKLGEALATRDLRPLKKEDRKTMRMSAFKDAYRSSKRVR